MATPVETTTIRPRPGPRDGRLILASASPRRRELLEAAGLSFDVVPAEIDERMPGDETPGEGVVRLSGEKARAVSGLYPGRVVLAADTVVSLGGKIFGKPRDAAEARLMLERLSGRVHAVTTGFAVVGGGPGPGEPGSGVSGSVETRVSFRNLTAREIDQYLARGESADKAGAYAVQLGGGALCDRIEGSYTNIVGLPLKEVLEALAAVMGFDPREK
ncbi:MAG: Maf family protein [Deltaproteobacteria bacterium]|jgi:septum formation protein|nr:Maf family protein [Deltaproteobacteria bacterium]